MIQRVWILKVLNCYLIQRVWIKCFKRQGKVQGQLKMRCHLAHIALLCNTRFTRTIGHEPLRRHFSTNMVDEYGRKSLQKIFFLLIFISFQNFSPDLYVTTVQIFNNWANIIFRLHPRELCFFTISTRTVNFFGIYKLNSAKSFVAWVSNSHSNIQSHIHGFLWILILSNRFFTRFCPTSFFRFS